MEEDVRLRVIKDFNIEASKAINLIQDFERNHGLKPRITRCIVHLSKGNIDLLKETIQSASVDWRDVIIYAENENIDFNKPFS